MCSAIATDAYEPPWPYATANAANDTVFSASLDGLGLEQPTRRGRGLLFAQNNAAGTEVRADSRESSPSAATADAVSVAQSPGWFEWGLPPVRWGGNLDAEIRSDKTGDQPRRLREAEFSTSRPSYIYQPWFALVSVAWICDWQGATSDSAILPADQSRKTSFGAVTGNGDLTLFPVSRFPFNAYFDVNEAAQAAS
jgi:hypothetical protein